MSPEVAQREVQAEELAMHWWWNGNPRMTGDLLRDAAEALFMIAIFTLVLAMTAFLASCWSGRVG